MRRLSQDRPRPEQLAGGHEEGSSGKEKEITLRQGGLPRQAPLRASRHSTMQRHEIKKNDEQA
jgi:hypothetical protein